MRTLITCAFVIIHFFAIAQNKALRLWKITEKDGTVLAGATIKLVDANTKATLWQGSSGVNGQVEVPVFTQEAKWIVTAVGHKASEGVLTAKEGEPNSELKVIYLEKVSKDLAGVSVQSKKPFIEVRADRTLINPEASATNAGTTVLELLEKTPGVMVDKDGEISLKGKAGVMVMIDGRPAQLSGADLAAYLRSLPTSTVEQLEIMTNPPAKYDAAGNAGVINIRTKKGTTYGYAGSVNSSAGVGIREKISNSVNMNYRKNAWNIFANGSLYTGGSEGRLDILRRFYDGSGQPTSVFDQRGRRSDDNFSLAGKLGVDYTLTKKTTLGMMVDAYRRTGTNDNNNTTTIMNSGAGAPPQTVAAQGSSEASNKWGLNLNARHRFDSTGRSLTVDLDRIQFDNQNHQSLSNYYYQSAASKAFRADTLYGNLPQLIDIWSAKADYLQPMKGGRRLEAGAKWSCVRTDNDAVYDTLHGGQSHRDYSRSNHFVYSEDIAAAYVSMMTPLKGGWELSGGLRLEHTIAKGNQITTGEGFNRNYTNLFPTLYVQRKLNEKHSLGINYGRRIRRPNYESLNPFIEYLDRYTYEQGNPNLRPQFSHNFELNHSWAAGLNTTLNHTRVTDMISEVLEQNTATNETFVRRANIASQRQWGLSVNYNKKLKPWWTLSAYAQAVHNRFEGPISGAQVVVKAPGFTFNSNHQFTLNPKWAAEVGGWFRTAGPEGVMIIKSMGALNLGLSKKIMDNKGTLRLTLRDALLTQRPRGVAKYADIDTRFQQQRDSRVVTLGFSYRFAKGQKVQAAQRQSSASDEAARAGGGN